MSDDGGSKQPPPESEAEPAVMRSRVTRMPSLLYGTAWKQEATRDHVLTALASGFRAIDTAGQRKHYREDLVGKAISEAQKEHGISRQDVWIQTKFTPLSGQDRNGPIPYDTSAGTADQVRQSFEASLANLNPDAKPGEAYIDSYLLHSPLTTLGATLEAWKALEGLVDRGLVRQIGLSNVYDPQIFNALCESARIKPTILQNRWHFSTGHDVSLLSRLSPVLSPNDFPLTEDVDPQGTPRGITYQPFWSLTGNPRLLSSPPVQDIAVRRKLTTAQVVYAFIAQGMGIPGLPTAVLSGTTDPQHMREAVEATADPQWEEAELDAVRKEVYGE